MDEEDQIVYMYSLDLRIAEFEEMVAHYESGSNRPLIEIAYKKLLWDEPICPMCYLYGSSKKNDFGCVDCPAGDSADGFCEKYVKLTDIIMDAILAGNVSYANELRTEMIWMLKQKRIEVSMKKLSE